MADKVAIALMRDRALERLTPALGEISIALGVEAPAMPDFYRDRDYLQARQLDALADWAEDTFRAMQLNTPLASERRPSNAATAKNKRPVG